MRQFKKRDACQMVANNLNGRGVLPFSAREYTVDNVTSIVNKFEHKHKDYFSLHEEQVIQEYVTIKTKLIADNEAARQVL